VTGKEGAPAHDGMGKLCPGPASQAAASRTEHYQSSNLGWPWTWHARGTEGECCTPQDREWGGPGGTLDAVGARAHAGMGMEIWMGPLSTSALGITARIQTFLRSLPRARL